MTNSESAIRIEVDATNPGQFFACCGLLELAERLWPGAAGWFEEGEFCIACDGTLATLMEAIGNAELVHLDKDDKYSSPIKFGNPFRDLVIDWWTSDYFGAKDFKVWAGTMESHGIARAMQHAMRAKDFREANFLNIGMVVPNPDEPKKKKEPYYFDARRAPNAHSRDVGFSANDLSLTTIAFPAVELLCLIGLQIARPSATNQLRVYDYCTWANPIPTNLLLAASSGRLGLPHQRTYRFENWFRTGQRKHKAFRPAIHINLGG